MTTYSLFLVNLNPPHPNFKSHKLLLSFEIRRTERCSVPTILATLKGSRYDDQKILMLFRSLKWHVFPLKLTVAPEMLVLRITYTKP